MAALELNGTPLKVNEILNNSTNNEENMFSHITEDGSVDCKGNPAVKAKTGRRTTAALLLVNYGLATLAFFGVGINLVLFLTRVMKQENADAANNVSKWTGTVYIFSLIGAFLSDSYFGRYLNCAIFQMIYVMGLTLLSMSSWFLLVKPSGCGNGKLECNPASTIGTAIFYVSIYVTALGYGGYQPSIATFGSDQFDETDPSERRSKLSFFGNFYFALNVGSLLSNTLLAYFEDTGKWVIGFWTSAGSAGLALMVFLLGTPRYRHFKASGNPLTRIAQVFIAVIRKWEVEVPNNEEMLYEMQGKESAIVGSRKILHSNEIRWLDKAATVSDEQYVLLQSMRISPWNLCTVTQVEEVKCVLKMLPIWVCTIMYSVVFTQMASLFVEQGATMDTRVGSLNISPANMSFFDIISVLGFTFINRRIIMPVIRRLSKNQKGPTELQGMAVGLVIGMLAMVASGVVEVERLKRVRETNKPSSLSILWQIPQYALIGASEVYMYVGQLDFFSGQAPDGMKSFGSSLYMASIALGNYVSIMIIKFVMAFTARGESPGWIPGNLNSGHLDRFFFLLAALTGVDLIGFWLCAKRYKGIKLEGSSRGNKMVISV